MEEDLSKIVILEVDLRQLAAILAALRAWQEAGFTVAKKCPAHLRAMATNQGALKALSSAEIDALCIAIN